MFRQATSRECLAEFTCASCAASYLNSDRQYRPVDSINLDLLRCPPWLFDVDCVRPTLPFADGPLEGVLVDPSGVSVNSEGTFELSLCTTCARCLGRNKVPPLSMANLGFLGQVPNELRDLTPVEESMIARCRAKCWVVQLREENQDLSLPDTQRGMKGHIIVYPQQPDKLLSVLPPSIDDVMTPICMSFVGSTPPSKQWLQEKAKPLVV
jgi:hypothetical protein